MASGAPRTRWPVQASWTYLGGPLGINAAGTVDIDPNDPSGNTVYVGTGEANICGSGCVAGTGIYKSTNGGATWTRSVGSRVRGKGVGEIVVKPGDPEHDLRRHDHRAARHDVRVLLGRDPTGAGRAKWGLYKSTNGGATWSSSTTARPTSPSARAT